MAKVDLIIFHKIKLKNKPSLFNLDVLYNKVLLSVCISNTPGKCKKFRDKLDPVILYKFVEYFRNG
jgi:hypothetical protein